MEVWLAMGNFGEMPRGGKAVLKLETQHADDAWGAAQGLQEAGRGFGVDLDDRMTLDCIYLTAYPESIHPLVVKTRFADGNRDQFPLDSFT